MAIITNGIKKAVLHIENSPIIDFLIFVVIPQEVILWRIIRPDVLDAILDITLIFYLLQILQNFQRRT